jgi:hypothetical protein
MIRSPVARPALARTALVRSFISTPGTFAKIPGTFYASGPGAESPTLAQQRKSAPQNSKGNILGGVCATRYPASASASRVWSWRASPEREPSGRSRSVWSSGDRAGEKRIEFLFAFDAFDYLRFPRAETGIDRVHMDHEGLLRIAAVTFGGDRDALPINRRTDPPLVGRPRNLHLLHLANILWRTEGESN